MLHSIDLCVHFTDTHRHRDHNVTQAYGARQGKRNDKKAGLYNRSTDIQDLASSSGGLALLLGLFFILFQSSRDPSAVRGPNMDQAS